MLFTGGKYQQSSLLVLFRRYTRRFERTVCNTFRDLKRAMEEATEIWTANPQKKPCFRKWEYQGKTALLLVVVLYTLVGSSECQRNASVTSPEQSAVYLQSAKKNIVTVFHSVKAVRLGGFWIFHEWGQINNYGESSIMIGRRKMLGYILRKLGASKANCAQTGRPRLIIV